MVRIKSSCCSRHLPLFSSRIESSKSEAASAFAASLSWRIFFESNVFLPLLAILHAFLCFRIRSSANIRSHTGHATRGGGLVVLGRKALLDLGNVQSCFIS